jgi:DNA-binding LacI/PurR family transcriptional regulator
MRAHIGLKDIAAQTGFSIKTVSRALNDHPDVKKETRARILTVAKKYSYYPNLVAKSLRTKQAFTIGYVVPDITNEFYGKVGIAIEREAKKHHYGLLVSFTEESRENEIDSLKLLLAERVDGIILATVGTTGEFIGEILRNYPTPLVVIDNRVESVKTNLVLHDNVDGAYLLTKHLIGHGHRAIACITGPLSETSGAERLLGYKKALEESGIPVEDRMIKISNWRVNGGYETACELMTDNSRRPSAVFIGNSVMALGVYKALRRMDRKIPDDVALTAFDSLEFTDAIDPPLTTLQRVEDRIGELAAGMLFERIQTRDTVTMSEHFVKASIIVRRSCGCT